MELKGKAALKIADIVSANIQTAHVFKKYGIDFCCGGGITIERACQKGNIDMDLLLDDLKNIGENVLQSQNFNNWKLDFLVDYIVNTHHAFVTESLELINAYVAKVCTVHGAAHPAVVKIKEKFELVAADLWAHMQKEERILFPYIKELVVANGRQIAFVPPPFGTIRNPILQMEEEHEFVGKLLKEIDALSDNYTPPEWACNTFKALYAKLSEFEQDLHLHIHLENNILFPKAIAMEQKLTKTITE